jgi:hypothetical protein
VKVTNGWSWRKTFTAFSKLTAAQVNGYLMDQSIMRFASATVRDAAFGGAGEPTLAEGMTCYLDDTNQIQSYNGSAWVTLVTTDQPPSLQLVSGITVTSAGGTSATVSNGVVTIGTGNTSVTVANAFSATYDNYKIIVDGGVCSTNTSFNLQIGSSISAYHYAVVYNQYVAPTPLGIGVTAGTSFVESGRCSTSGNNMNVEVFAPFLTRRTGWRPNSLDYDTSGYGISGSGFLNDSTSHTSFTVKPSAGTITGGIIRVYGYRNQL